MCFISFLWLLLFLRFHIFTHSEVTGMFPWWCVCSRCVPVCGVDLLSGSAVHVHVHCDGNLPVHTEETETKRSAPTLISYQWNIVFPSSYNLLLPPFQPKLTQLFISLQIITFWSKALKTGTMSRQDSLPWANLLSVATTEQKNWMFASLVSLQFRWDSHQRGQCLSCSS